jgi:hypothetical protein
MLSWEVPSTEEENPTMETSQELHGEQHFFLIRAHQYTRFRKLAEKSALSIVMGCTPPNKQVSTCRSSSVIDAVFSNTHSSLGKGPRLQTDRRGGETETEGGGERGTGRGGREKGGRRKSRPEKKHYE